MAIRYFRRNWYELSDNVRPFESHRPDECLASEAEWFEHDAFQHGDYCGSGALARSNIRVWREQFGDSEGELWEECTGSYGSAWLRFAPEVLHHAEMREALESLDNYPALDEDDWRELESDEEDAAWREYGADDFRRELAKLAPHHEDMFHRVPDDLLYMAWREYCDAHRCGETVVHEQSGPCFPFYQESRGRRWTWEIMRACLRDALADR